MLLHLLATALPTTASLPMMAIPIPITPKTPSVVNSTINEDDFSDANVPDLPEQLARQESAMLRAIQSHEFLN